MKNILIVEDSQEIIDLIKIYMEQEEYFIYEACDGESAINIFEKEEIHLVVLDIMLPRGCMDGDNGVYHLSVK